jgi:hypothetical protein
MERLAPSRAMDTSQPKDVELRLYGDETQADLEPRLTDMAISVQRGGRDLIRHFERADPKSGGCGLCQTCLARPVGHGLIMCVFPLPPHHPEGRERLRQYTPDPRSPGEPSPLAPVV